jgi:hypothetical protein
LNTSSNPATNNGTVASVTPTTLTTSNASVTLDGSASVSGSGNLTYLYSVLAGGKVPAILQTPNNPMATIQFVKRPRHLHRRVDRHRRRRQYCGVWSHHPYLHRRISPSRALLPRYNHT